jgi:hypothetical protein
MVDDKELSNMSSQLGKSKRRRTSSMTVIEKIEKDEI